MKVAAALQAWQDYRWKLVGLGLVAESTWRNQDQICGQLTARLGDFELDGLRKSHIEIYAGERLQTCCPVTVQGELNVLRQAMNWCLDEQILATKPRFPSVKVDEAEQELPSDEAFLWALAAVPPHHAAALEFMMLMGLAPHELERLQTRDNTHRPGSIVPIDHPLQTTLAAYAGTPTEPVGIAIGQREDFQVKQPSRKRWVPMNGRAADIWREATLGTRFDHHPFPKGGAIQRALARARVGAKEAPAGAELVTPKMMRKWFASKLASPGEDGRAPVPEHVLQRLLGHAAGSKVTRRHYVRSQGEQLVDATKGLKP